MANSKTNENKTKRKTTKKTAPGSNVTRKSTAKGSTTTRKKGMTQKTLAQLSGIRESTISDIVRGTRTVINFEHLSKIAEALKVNDIRELIDFK